jgi:cysteine desulfurase
MTPSPNSVDAPERIHPAMTDIYLDNNGTTPVAPRVLEAMLPYLQGEFGNPSSATDLGHRAKDAVENARSQVAALIGAQPDEILFVSGGTEANNFAIRGAATKDRARTGVVTTTIEHPATEECCAWLSRNGHDVVRVAPSRLGIVQAEAVAKAVNANTAIVTVIHAQNEIGTLQPIAEIAALAKAHGALVHTDAAQSTGKVPIDVDALGVDLLSIAGHKLYAPKGIGALYIRRGVSLAPLLFGAGQEHGRRPGTENVPYIVALGEACRLAAEALRQGAEANIRSLSELLLSKLRAEVPHLVLVGDERQRLPNTLNVLFPGVSGRALLASCAGVIASNGSACHADSEEPSAILLALGIPRDAALGTVRLSLGRNTTRDDVEAAARRLGDAWRGLAKLSRKG